MMKCALFSVPLFLASLSAIVGAAPSLREVGDVGKIVDSQGISSVRAKVGTRWTGAERNMPLKPGDWLRTDLRGANALQARLAGGSTLILGPGTLVEVGDQKQLNMVRGELEVAPGKGLTVIIEPSNGKSYPVRKKTVLRRRDGQERGFEVLAKDPDWLKGFKGVAVSESMGRLVAQVDGRNTPLTIGYHKVTVDIRDQIARTTIEESFVNHTDSRLEGVFYFPLPQDASIAGFGMWINGELVEADVVEKQRAREIYETILRERRDPGLLEWTGGNIFKARVFPIFAHSEKRIKITYTQVLPCRNGKYRYSYALQSEMLKQTPLRELSLTVRANSALPIAKFTCPTHEARITVGAHAAQAEFTAQEYTPSSDFEVEIETGRADLPVTLIPHRRGEDGYFMALVTPPDAGGNWERELVPDGDAVHLLILADTSGSMDPSARSNQDALIAALLGSLGGDDTFEIATCDTQIVWADGLQKNRDPEETIAAARDFVASRPSLGWTDLEEVFSSAIERANSKAHQNVHVVYIGDGVITTGAADPVAFAQKLQRQYEGKKGTFHAVAPSSKFESVVLKAIASLGGGSVRKIEGSDTASVIANRLLTEIGAPGSRDMQIEFRGMRTARVYPEVLPNLPRGQQQLIIGRYLPQAGEAAQVGEIVVTGFRDGKKVVFRAPVSLKNAESGNSFIPRLWARKHLDVLLEEGRSQEVRDDIISLSEEYHIMTPYTSFLVLESEADRERFKVKRRFEMRDGEKFFADGRDAANYELLQQQMKNAGTWRLNLRRKYLRELKQLGRRPIYSANQPNPGLMEYAAGIRGRSEVELIREFNYPTEFESRFSISARVNPEDAFEERDEEDFQSPEFEPGEGEGKLWDDMDLASAKDLLPMAQEQLAKKMPAASSAPGRNQLRRQAAGKEDAGYFVGGGKGKRNKGGGGFSTHGSEGWHWRHYMQDLQSLFPAPVGLPGQGPDRSGLKWPDEAVVLADSLLRREKLAALEGGVDYRVDASYRELRFGRTTGSNKNRLLVGRDGWLRTSRSDRSVSPVQWCYDGERGVLDPVFQLGRLRKSGPGEGEWFGGVIPIGTYTSLADQFAGFDAKVVKKGADRAQLTLTIEQHNQKSEYRFEIDTARQVLLQRDTLIDGKLSEKLEFSNFVKAGGLWWARRIKRSNEKGELLGDTKISVKTLTAEALKAAIRKELAVRQKVIFLKGDLPAVEIAKQAELDKKATLESDLVLVQHFARTQQWKKADPYFEKLRDRVGQKPGFGWLEMRYLGMKRRNEELKTAATVVAKKLAARKRGGDYQLAQFLQAEGARALAQNEKHALLVLLGPVYERQLARTLDSLKEWQTAHMWSLRNIGRQSEALAAAKTIALTYDWDAASQTNYINLLSLTGDRPAALARIEEIIELEIWTDPERVQFRQNYVGNLEQLARYQEVHDYLAAWIGEDPKQVPAWGYQRFLDATIRLGQVDEVYGLMSQWIARAIELDDAGVEGEARAKVEGSLNILFGYGRYYRQILAPQFHEPLAKLVRKFATSVKHHHLAERIMSDYRFRHTDEVRELRAEQTERLVMEGAKLPLMDVRRLVGWISQNDPVVEKATWQKIVDPLIARWSAEEAVAMRDQWAPIIITILGNRIGGEVLTDFMRRQYKEGPKEEKGRYAYALFNHLTTTVAWTAEREEEAFDLLYLISGASQQVVTVEKGGKELLFRASALLQLNDWVLNNGFTVLYAKVEKKEELSRTELAEAQAEKRKEIREHLFKRLEKELAERKDIEAGFRPWLLAERLYLDLHLGHETKAVAVECWEFLGGLGKLIDFKKRTPNELTLLDRYLDMLEFTAAHPKAEEQLVKRVFALYDASIASTPEDDAWKLRKHRLLVALDRPVELKAVLKKWIVPGQADTHWRVTLGYLLAELNELEQAISEFEAVEKADELRSREYRVLADWYLVMDRKQKREAALLGVYNTLNENQVSQMIYRHSARIRQSFDSGVPEDFDPEVVSMFTVLFRKSQRPSNYVSQLANLYGYTKDFRLLECLPEGIIGHTSLQVFPFLQQMTSVHRQIEDEATADSIFKLLEEVRGRAKTRTDQRGLDLLEMLVRRKASEVLNQPGQHLPRALAAMKRAFQGEWSDGERKEMAAFLHALGKISQEPLAAEQIHEMEILHRDEQAGDDRMRIGHLRGQLLWQYGRHDDALTVLEGVLRDSEARGVEGETLPQTAQGVLHTYLGFLVEIKRFAGAEKELARHLGREVVNALRSYLVGRKYTLYHETLQGDGRISLGKGPGLYRNIERTLVAELEEVDHDLRYTILHTFLGVYSTAHSKNYAGVGDDAKVFAYETFDTKVPFETKNYQNLVRQMGGVLKYIEGPVEGLRFLITRYEKESPLFLAMQQGGWNAYGHDISEYRYRAGGQIGDLSPRLLKIVKIELRRNLTTRDGNQPSIYWHASSSAFWKEKKAVFVQVANEVVVEHADSLQTLAYVAGYFDTLKMLGRSIEILIEAYNRKQLDEGSWSVLVRYLERERRWKEAVQYLLPLIEFRPDVLDYRMRLMIAYHSLDERKLLEGVLITADRRWKEKDWWNESTLAALGQTCATTHLWERCVGYYDELIPMYRRARNNRIKDDSTLSSHYQVLAQAHGALQNTAGAVDAASGAILCWGSDHGNRASALRSLLSVLEASRNLGSYVAHLDKEVGETGLENPIVRKALGKVYLGKKEYDKAIVQLRLAVETQPNDPETHSALVEASTKKADEAGAIKQLLASTKLGRRNIKLFEDLAERYDKMGRPVEAERARTSIVESLPNESEGHAMLAEIRQKQERWDEAADHWEQVAVIRALEPTGLQRLGDAQIRLERFEAARNTLEKLLEKNWPSRFGDVHRDARQKLSELEKKAS